MGFKFLLSLTIQLDQHSHTGVLRLLKEKSPEIRGILLAQSDALPHLPSLGGQLWTEVGREQHILSPKRVLCPCSVSVLECRVSNLVHLLHMGLLATLPWPMVSDEYKRKRMEINLLGLGAYRDQMLSEPFF